VNRTGEEGKAKGADEQVKGLYGNRLCYKRVPARGPDYDCVVDQRNIWARRAK
jgi:hypothetical protein